MHFHPESYQYSIGMHQGQDVIWVKFPYHDALIQQLRAHTHARWSSSQKCWYVKDTDANRRLFNLVPRYLGKEALSKIHPGNQDALEQYINTLRLKAYSPNTIKTYCTEFAQLLYTLKDFSVVSLSPEQLKSYCLYCIKELRLSENQMHSRINALKFYFEQVLKREKFFFEIPRPKKPILLPKLLSAEEITRLFAVTENLKHLLLLQLCYGMGLRVSEVVQLKLEHIDSHRMQVLIAQAKGKKDRYVHLPQSVLALLRKYYQQYKPKYYLFEGQAGATYSMRSAQAVFKLAMNKAGIHKTVGIHSLRHSYATHLLEWGTDISLIQKLLGHRNIKTTLTYTQVAQTTLNKIISPLDRL